MTEPVVLRPRRLLLVCRLAGVVLILVFGIVAWALPKGEAGGEQFRLPDQLAFFGIGLLLSALVLRFTRVRVVADESGALIRNYVGEKFVPWQVVAGVRMDDGSPWASLDLHDDDTIALLGVQANDGARAVDGVLALRDLLARSRQAPP
ncbi:MAG: PH domain-containing protein [Frankiaceae bacterium]|nr:PH domain-containing protein [Frankiaceae bacterium]